MGTIERRVRFDSIEERTEYIRSLFKEDNVLYLSRVGTTYYVAIEHTDEVKAYIVTTYQKTNPHYMNDYCFGYRIECEDAGPHHWEAPYALLNLLTPTENDYACEWRAKCARTLHNRATLKGVAPGTCVRVADSASELFYCVRKRDGGKMWINERRTRYIPFSRLIQHELEVVGVDSRFEIDGKRE